MDDIIVWIIVFFAIVYLFYHFSRQFSPKRNCSGGCKSCSAKIDWDKVR